MTNRKDVNKKKAPRDRHLGAFVYILGKGKFYLGKSKCILRTWRFCTSEHPQETSHRKQLRVQKSELVHKHRSNSRRGRGQSTGYLVPDGAGRCSQC